MKRATQILLDCLLVLGMLVLATQAYAGNDTVEGLMSAAKEGAANSAALLSAATEANNFQNRLATDKDYAAKILEAVKKKDQNQISTMIRQVVNKNQVTLQGFNADFYFFFTAKTPTIFGHYCSVCIDTRNLECAPDSTGCK